MDSQDSRGWEHDFSMSSMLSPPASPVLSGAGSLLSDEGSDLLCADNIISDADESFLFDVSSELPDAMSDISHITIPFANEDFPVAAPSTLNLQFGTEREYEIEPIIQWRVGNARLQYMAQWVGRQDHQVWYDHANFEPSLELVQVYHTAHPEETRRLLQTLLVSGLVDADSGIPKHGGQVELPTGRAFQVDRVVAGESWASRLRSDRTIALN